MIDCVMGIQIVVVANMLVLVLIPTFNLILLRRVNVLRSSQNIFCVKSLGENAMYLCVVWVDCVDFLVDTSRCLGKILACRM